MELAIYGDWKTARGLSFVLDAGAGRQQVARFDEARRGWTRMLRASTSLAGPVAPGTDLELGFERNDWPLGGSGSAPSADWRSLALTLSLRASLGP